MSRKQPVGAVPYVFSGGEGCVKHMDWITRVFGGNVDFSMKKDDGTVEHAAMTVNGGPIYFSDRVGGYGAPDKTHPPSYGTHLYLGFDEFEDAQKRWEEAVGNGAKVRMEFEKQYWGPHYGVLEDPFGSVWAISATHPNQKKAKTDE